MQIAIVDDHELMRVGLESILATQPDWHVSWSGERLEDFLTTATKVDVLILDIDLGGKAVDVELVEEAKRRGFPVLLVSAFASDRTAREIARAGVSGFVSKAHSSDTLVEAVTTVASGGEWIGEEAMQMLISIDSDQVPHLTEQELRVLKLYSSGMTVQAVANLMNLAPATVHFHLKKIRAKFAEASRPSPGQIDLYRTAVDFGLVD